MLSILSEFTNVVNNDADNGWTSILDKFKKSIPEINSEINSFIDLLNSDPNSKLWDTTEIVTFAKECNIADETFLSFLKTWDGTGDIAENYQQYLSKASSANAKFASTFKTIAANMAIMLAINLAIKAALKLWDTVNETVEEQEQKISELKSSYESLKTEYDELSQKQDVLQNKTTE